MVFTLAFLIGVMAGLRSLAPPAVVSWVARLGWLKLGDTPMAFLASPVAPYLFTVCAIGELITDKLPKTPSRKAPMGFIARVASGAVCGAALGAPGGAMLTGLGLGVAGAVLGTLGGYELRTRLVKATGGKDLPIALLEDLIAIGGSLLLAASGAA